MPGAGQEFRRSLFCGDLPGCGDRDPIIPGLRLQVFRGSHDFFPWMHLKGDKVDVFVYGRLKGWVRGL